jgi:3,2-trans-enoyl-CoA isomerase
MITLARVTPKLATLTLAQEPVNLMNTKLWQDLAAAIKSLEADPNVEAVIIESGLKRDVFTAGNDLS